MTRWIIEFEYHGKQTVEVSQPTGAGGVYYVHINKYYAGQMVNYITGWTPIIEYPKFLQGDDIGVIMDWIEERG